MYDREARLQSLKALLDHGFITRRQFLTASAAMGAGAIAAGVLAACGGTEATPTTEDGGFKPPTTVPAAVPTATKVPQATTAPQPTAKPTAPVAATATTSALIPSGVKLEKNGEVVIGSWGGTWEEGVKQAHTDPFAKYYDGKLIFDSYDVAKVKAMEEAGNVEWDIGSDAEFEVLRVIKDGFAEKLDYSLIPASSELEKVAIQDYYIGGEIDAYVFGYNKEKYGNNPPKTWADFFDVENFPGARSMFDYPSGCVDAALLADGVPPDQLYEVLRAPGGVDRAFKKLEAFKATGAITKFWTKGAEAQQLLKDKEVDMVETWNGRISTLITGGASHVAIEFNQGLYFLNPWFVLKNPPNGKNGMSFLNVTCLAEAQAVMYESTHYGPSNAKAVPLISDTVRPFLPTNPTNFDKMIHMDGPWWVDNLDSIMERWKAFTSA